jgi:hypothetical protein
MSVQSSLSDIIIYGHSNELETALNHQAAAGHLTLDEIDEYGYTPLVQTAIVNDAEKAEILLAAGAHVDFQDLTGRTALHWSADNKNEILCRRLLDAGANPNAYTYAGQPVLTLPYLRQSTSIKNLLIQRGAKLPFAQDFINAKVLGHQFELEGRCDIVDPTDTFFEIELEGFYLETTLDIVLNSLITFKKNYGGRELRPLFSELDIVIASLKNAAELLKFQHYLVNKQTSQKPINQLLTHRPLILPIAASGHAINFIYFTDWLIRCDRGAFGKKHGTIIFYKVRQPEALTLSFMKSLLYQKQHADFINEGIINYLGLEPMSVLSLLPQKTGNCAWANVEALVPTLLLVLLHAKKSTTDLKTCQEKALQFYNEWREWSKNRALHFCLETFKTANEARKAAKCTLLAAILFQSCQYGNPRDLPKARKLLNTLSQPKFRYVLESYLQVFSKKTQDPAYQNLLNYLDDFGIDIVNPPPS